MKGQLGREMGSFEGIWPAGREVGEFLEVFLGIGSWPLKGIWKLKGKGSWIGSPNLVCKYQN